MIVFITKKILKRKLSIMEEYRINLLYEENGDGRKSLSYETRWAVWLY